MVYWSWFPASRNRIFRRSEQTILAVLFSLLLRWVVLRLWSGLLMWRLAKAPSSPAFGLDLPQRKNHAQYDSHTWVNLHFNKDRLIRLCHSFTMEKEGGGRESGESYRDFKRWKFSNRIWIFCDIFGGVLVLWRWPKRFFDGTKPCPLLPHSHPSQWQLTQSPARHDTFE